jgi:hypothetical protein
MSHLKHAGAAASVHFKIAALVEQRASVHRVEMAVLGMHVVGIVQASRDLGSQQPWTPLRVLVAQMEVFGHVIEDSGRLLERLCFWSARDVREEPEMKPQVLSPEFVWRLKSEKPGNCGAGVGAGLQLSGTGAKIVGSGNAHGKAAAKTAAGATSTHIA